MTSTAQTKKQGAGAAAILTCVAVLYSCASGGCASGGAANPRYPRRPPGCELAVFHTAVPGVVAWDDLGLAEASCNIGLPVAECLRILRAEACRMGGDLLYNVPRKPFRPRDQVLLFRGQVAHTRVPGAKSDDHAGEGETEKPTDEDLPPPASSDESAGPVVPLPSAHPPGAAKAQPGAPPEKAPTP